MTATTRRVKCIKTATKQIVTSTLQLLSMCKENQPTNTTFPFKKVKQQAKLDDSKLKTYSFLLQGLS